MQVAREPSIPGWLAGLDERVANLERLLLTPAAWTTVTFEHSWKNNGSGYTAAAYCKDPLGFVHVRGLIVTGTTGTVAFTLPAGYRPGTKIQNGTVGAGPSVASVEVTTVGEVLVFYTSGPVFLEPLSFYAEN